MAIYDVNGNQIIDENGEIENGSVTPEKTSFMEVETEIIETTFENLLTGVGWTSVTGTQFNNGMGYGTVTDAKITLPKGTYYFYAPYKNSAGGTFKLYAEDENGAFTDVTSTIATISDNNGNFLNGTYDEYHNEGYSTYQPNGVGYLVEVTFVLSEDFTGYIHTGSATYITTEPNHVYLFTKQYNPLKDAVDDVINEYLFFVKKYGDGFVKKLLENEVMKQAIIDALPVHAVPNSYGKTWYHIGDSNSQWMGGTVLEDETSTGFLLTAARKNGISKFTNASMAGASWAYRVDYEDSLNAQCGIARVDDLVASGEVPDIITFLLGTNADDDAGTTDNTASDTYTTAGAIRYCLEKLLVAFPTSAIGVMLPMQRAETYTHQETKNALIKELCEYYSIPVLDLFHEGQVVPDSKLTAYDDGHTGVIYTDSAHITTVNGVAQLGRKISEWLNRI